MKKKASRGNGNTSRGLALDTVLFFLARTDTSCEEEEEGGGEDAHVRARLEKTNKTQTPYKLGCSGGVGGV